MLFYKWLSIRCIFDVLLHDIVKGTTRAHIFPTHQDHDIRGLSIIDEICDRLISNEYRNFAKLFFKVHMRLSKIPNIALKKQYG